MELIQTVISYRLTDVLIQNPLAKCGLPIGQTSADKLLPTDETFVAHYVLLIDGLTVIPSSLLTVACKLRWLTIRISLKIVQKFDRK
jgi:hypothetical protein